MRPSSGSSNTRKKAKQGAMYGVLGVPVKTVSQRKKIAGGMSGMLIGAGGVAKNKKVKKGGKK